MKRILKNKKAAASVLMAIFAALVGMWAIGYVATDKVDWFMYIFDKHTDLDTTVWGKPYTIRQEWSGCPYDESNHDTYYNFRSELFEQRRYEGVVAQTFDEEELLEVAEDAHAPPRISKSDYETIRDNFEKDASSYTLYSVTLHKNPSQSCLDMSKPCTFTQFSEDYFGASNHQNLEEQCYRTEEASRIEYKKQRELRRLLENEQGLT